MVVVDSVISENDVRSANIKYGRESTCFLEGTSLNYSKKLDHIRKTYCSLVKLSVAKMVMAQCSVENVYNVNMFTLKKTNPLFPGKLLHQMFLLSIQQSQE